jgi:hypothetical protein
MKTAPDLMDESNPIDRTGWCSCWKEILSPIVLLAIELMLVVK